MGGTVFRGRDRYQIWTRDDHSEGIGPTIVRFTDEWILEAGDVVIFPPPPQDIHLQQGYEGETAYEFVLFGENVLGRLPQLVFDVEGRLATEVHPR